MPLGTLLSIKKSDLKTEYIQSVARSVSTGGFEMSIADLLKYTLQQSDNNACDILFNFKAVDSVNRYIQSLGIRDCEITHTENDMHEDLNLCYSNWSTPLAAAKLLEIFRRKIVR